MSAVVTPVVPVRRAAGMVAVPVSAVVGNAMAYAMLLVAARVLDHGHYGSFVALTTTMGVGAIPSLALQAVAARRTARGEGLDGLGRTTLVLAVITGAVVAAVAVPLDAFLHVDSTAATLWLAAGLVPLTASGPLLGTVQGEERLVAFAALSLLQAAGRFGGALVPLVAGTGEAGAMAGAALATLVATVIGAVVVRRVPWRTAGDGRAALRETVHAVHGYAAILVLVSLDLLLARHVLPDEQAAQYAAGSIVTKAVVWLPQSVGLVVFARLAAHDGRTRTLRRAAAVVGGVGLASTLGAWLLGDLVAAVVGGDFDILRGDAWLFALLGTALGLLQFTAVAGLAGADTRRLAPLWIAAAGEVVVAVLLGADATAVHVVTAMAAVVGVVAAAAVWSVARAPRRS